MGRSIPRERRRDTAAATLWECGNGSECGGEGGRVSEWERVGECVCGWVSGSVWEGE